MFGTIDCITCISCIIVGTIDCITVCTVASSIGGRVSDSIGVAAIGTGNATIIGVAHGVRRTLSASVARWC